MKRLLLSIFFAAVLSTAAVAQDTAAKPTAAPNANPMISYHRMMYSGVRSIILKSAEKVPEENYAFKPTEQVRSFGQILGHIADSQYGFCSSVVGEKNPAVTLRIEKTKSSKADLVSALKDAFAYCDKAFDGITDANATQMVKHFGNDSPKLGVLAANSLHSVEHYGNLVTYMRMKNITPPTSDPEVMKEMMKMQKQ